jgi:Na+/H+-dicarboxylate symporter
LIRPDIPDIVGAMKVWVKLLLGSALGLGLGFFLPQDNAAVTGVLLTLEHLAIGIGRYAAPPLLVLSLVVAIYELRSDGKFWGMLFKTFLLIAALSLLVIFLGIGAALVFPTAQIPIINEEQTEEFSLSVRQNLLDLFPSNMLTPLSGAGTYLLPLYVFAFFFAIGLSYDRSHTKPVLSLLDSLSRVFYHLASFLSEILGVIMIALSAYWALRFRDVLDREMFRALILFLGGFTLILGFGILPLFLYMLRSPEGAKTNPWAALYGSLGPVIAAFFSGDVNFTLPVLIRHNKENLGIRRRSSSVTLALFSALGRSGSAMIAAMAFIIIIKSYSSLGLTTADVLSVGFTAFGVSFLLSRRPGDAAYAALAILSLRYGRGSEAWYLILKPVAFYLIALGCALDALLASLGSLALAKIGGFQENKNVRHFI